MAGARPAGHTRHSVRQRGARKEAPRRHARCSNPYSQACPRRSVGARPADRAEQSAKHKGSPKKAPRCQASCSEHHAPYAPIYRCPLAIRCPDGHPSARIPSIYAANTPESLTPTPLSQEDFQSNLIDVDARHTAFTCAFHQRSLCISSSHRLHIFPRILRQPPAPHARADCAFRVPICGMPRESRLFRDAGHPVSPTCAVDSVGEALSHRLLWSCPVACRTPQGLISREGCRARRV